MGAFNGIKASHSAWGRRGGRRLLHPTYVSSGLLPGWVSARSVWRMWLNHKSINDAMISYQAVCPCFINSVIKFHSVLLCLWSGAVSRRRCPVQTPGRVFTVSFMESWKGDHRDGASPSVIPHGCLISPLPLMENTCPRSLLVSGLPLMRALGLEPQPWMTVVIRSPSPLRFPLAPDCYLAFQWRLAAPPGRHKCACQQEPIGANRGRWWMDGGWWVTAAAAAAAAFPSVWKWVH